MSDIRTWTPESDILKPGEPCSVQEIRSWFERLPRMRALIRQQQEHIESQRRHHDYLQQLRCAGPLRHQ